MKRLLLVLFTLAALLNAKEIAGVALQESLHQNDLTLTLQGAGIRQKLFFDLYVAALYTSKNYATAQALLDDDAPMGLRLHVISSMITSEKMETATREGFETVTHHHTQPLHDAIEALIGTFQEPIAQNDVYDLIYAPQQGVLVYKNGVLKQRIADLAFKKALFAIWLGDAPIQDSLKQALLGR